MESFGLALDKQPGKGLKAVGNPEDKQNSCQTCPMNSMNTALRSGNF